MNNYEDCDSPPSKRRYERFSFEQKLILDKHFKSGDIFPKRSVRVKLAEQLGVGQRKIQIWFQNRRAKIPKAEEQPQPELPAVVAHDVPLTFLQPEYLQSMHYGMYPHSPAQLSYSDHSHSGAGTPSPGTYDQYSLPSSNSYPVQYSSHHFTPPSTVWGNQRHTPNSSNQFSWDSIDISGSPGVHQPFL